MRNTPGARQDWHEDWFSDGMTQVLIEELSRIGTPYRTRRTLRFKSTARPLSEIAKKLNVDGVMLESVVRDGEQVRIVQLYDGRSCFPFPGARVGRGHRQR